MDTVVRPQARLVEVSDGDTYYLLVNWLRDREFPWHGAQIAKVRLRDYSAREKYDRATADPRGLNRIDGPAAIRAAEQLLDAALIQAEFQGLDDRGREVCWIWVNGRSLGAELLKVRAVAKISQMGAGE
jgi:endonuclease YncB( thermonuclease family)